MPGPEELLEAGMLASIAAAILIFLALILAKVRKGSKIRDDFTVLISAFIVGWMAAEVLALLSPPELDLVTGALHFTVILVFTVFLALRWRWAFRAALEEVRT